MLTLEKNHSSNKWSKILFSWIGKLNILFNLISRFNAFPISASYFVDTNKLILKIIWKGIFLYYGHEFFPKQALMKNLLKKMKREVSLYHFNYDLFSSLPLPNHILSFLTKTLSYICSFTHSRLYSSKK